ncbi:MAG: DUF3160 domain-containing protein [Desulfomonile tiedjei]|nr:DUF3160 domain-containing protein [Desulfomonile tiedjei]
MNGYRAGSLVSAVAILCLWATCLTVHSAGKVKQRALPERQPTVLEPAIQSPIGPADTNWVKTELAKGEAILLTNSYLFETMKGVAQQNQIAVEQTLLVSLLAQTLKEFVARTDDPQVRRLFGVPLLLLTESPGVELPEEVAKQAEQIKGNAMFRPRGHYTDSPIMGRYFQAMQYLAKATIDVSVQKQAFPFPEDMLFPFETAQGVVKLFTDPSNKKLIELWTVVHDFYSGVNGRPDLPTFADLPVLVKSGSLVKEDVEKWARQQGLPKINPERGLGIQPLGERYSLHEEVIDRVKQEFIKDDTPREEISKVLAFEKLLEGYRVGERSIEGIDQAISGQTGDTYYLTALKAISLGGRDWTTSAVRRNFYAGSLTSLAEQTVLMTKTAILVRKSAAPVKKIPDGLKLYFEPDSSEYLQGLAEAAGRMVEVCERIRLAAPEQEGSKGSIVDIGPALEAFAKLSRESRPLVVGTAEWQAHGAVATELARKPAVTVDVFQVKERSGKVNYYQWAVAPFEATYALEGSKGSCRGMTTIFFEGWSDEIIPGSEGPLNNLQWEGRLLEGDLGKLHSIIKLPRETGAK